MYKYLLILFLVFPAGAGEKQKAEAAIHVLKLKIAHLKKHPKIGDRKNLITFKYNRGVIKKREGYLLDVFEKTEKFKFMSMKTYREIVVSKADLIDPTLWIAFVAAKRKHVNSNDKYSKGMIAQYEQDIIVLERKILYKLR